MIKQNRNYVSLCKNVPKRNAGDGNEEVLKNVGLQYLVITCNGKESEKEHICVYNWITLLYTWNQYLINQLYFNFFLKGGKKENGDFDPNKKPRLKKKEWTLKFGRA